MQPGRLPRAPSPPSSDPPPLHPHRGLGGGGRRLLQGGGEHSQGGEPQGGGGSRREAAGHPARGRGQQALPVHHREGLRGQEARVSPPRSPLPRPRRQGRPGVLRDRPGRRRAGQAGHTGRVQGGRGVRRGGESVGQDQEGDPWGGRLRLRRLRRRKRVGRRRRERRRGRGRGPARPHGRHRSGAGTEADYLRHVRAGPREPSADHIPHHHVLRELRGVLAQAREDGHPPRPRERAREHAHRVLLPGAHLPPVLRPRGAALLPPAPPVAGGLRGELQGELRHHPQAGD
mmetsp:Transcript_13043/g.26748  ORF Transcript_13043/g.26748 Transcript_13043/m.26748 type:complete len:288 (+) Transcript_13043:712-1575(+)